MIKEIVKTNAFHKDIKRLKKRGKNLNKLEAVLGAIVVGEKLPDKNRAHMLSGDWSGYWECHIEPDWLLIWCYKDDKVMLARSGTHSDFGW